MSRAERESTVPWWCEKGSAPPESMDRWVASRAHSSPLLSSAMVRHRLGHCPGRHRPIGEDLEEVSKNNERMNKQSGRILVEEEANEG